MNKMSKEEFENTIKDYIKENVSIRVETKSGGSECSYNESTYVCLFLGKELISESEIQPLSKDY